MRGGGGKEVEERRWRRGGGRKELDERRWRRGGGGKEVEERGKGGGGMVWIWSGVTLWEVRYQATQD